jgi:predicted ATPase
VTSREPLHAYGECRFHVPPLELPGRQHLPHPDGLARLASIILFLQRAQARKSDVALSPANAGTISAICLHLDGLPLAIELAAAQMEDLTPEQILAGLGDRLKLLRGDLRYLPPRQMTLRGAIDWSYHLLTTGERILFRRLGVFVGGCHLAAVQAVCNAHQDLPFDLCEGITALSSKSLLYRVTGVEGEPRWRMLESIREYARERLEASSEAPKIHRLHAEYCVGLAEAAKGHQDGPEELIWLDCLDQDHENLRAALDWAIAQSLTETALRLSTAAWPFWWRRGYVSEGRRWLKAVLSLPSDGVADLLRAKVFHAAGALARVQSDFDSAKQFHQQALTLRRRVGDHKGIAASLNSLGIPLMFEGYYAEAEVLFQESLNAYRELGLKAQALMPLNNLAVTVMYQGDYGRAQQLHEEALGLYRELQDRQGMAGSLGNLGDVLRYQGNYARARQVLEESLSIFREARSKQDIAITLDSLARVDLATGHIDCAVLALAECLTLNREVGDKMAIADNLEGVAAAICAQADRLQTHDASICAAVRWLAAADMLRGAIGSPRSPAECAEVDRVVAQLRDQLTPDTFRVEWCHGETMSAHQVIEEALAHLEQTA